LHTRRSRTLSSCIRSTIAIDYSGLNNVWPVRSDQSDVSVARKDISDHSFKKLFSPAAPDTTRWRYERLDPRPEPRSKENHISLFLTLSPFSFFYVGIDADATNARRRRSHLVCGNLRPVQIHCHEVGEDEGGNLVTDLSRRNGKG